MPAEVPAVIAVTRAFDGGTQTIYACASHQSATIAAHRENGDGELAVTPADPAVHGCKGCLDDWPPDAPV